MRWHVFAGERHITSFLSEGDVFDIGVKENMAARAGASTKYLPTV